MREGLCDISISDYICENYQSIQTFYEPHHPSIDVISEMGRRILNILKMENQVRVPLTIANDGGEIPVYGCVRRALKMKYENLYIRNYSHQYTLHGRALSISEYVEEYIAWHYSC